MQTTSMFTSVNSRSAAAYKRVSVQTSVEGASPHQLISMLFDALLAHLHAARRALAQGDIENKGKEIGKAVRIIEEGLKANLDVERGGEVAINLRGVYNYSIAHLTKANVKNDDAMIAEVIALLTPVSGAWKQIAPQQKAAA